MNYWKLGWNSACRIINLDNPATMRSEDLRVAQHQLDITERQLQNIGNLTEDTKDYLTGYKAACEHFLKHGKIEEKK